ncbi:c-type cytochrome [Salipiger sp.]|uniref:c-type cytochrome n=1 Tax=Salipiger sp. TaxID=2078585 RepID=UPI003A9832AB
MLRNLLGATCLVLLPATAALAESHAMAGDAAKGEKVFRKCMACHAVGADAKNKVGPELNGVVGRPIATAPDFDYSDALMALGEGGTAWTAETLAEFLAKPKDYAKGTKMSFAGLRKDEDRADVIAYLAKFNMDGEEGGS